MALGGVPYYLDKLRNDQTMTENLDRIFFADEKIHQEFKDVYAGLYQKKERYVDIVKALGGMRVTGRLCSSLSHLQASKNGLLR